MDPNAALSAFADNMHTGDFADAETNAEALYNWIAQGGFKPTNWATKERNECLTRCRAMMREASDADTAPA